MPLNYKLRFSNRAYIQDELKGNRGPVNHKVQQNAESAAILSLLSKIYTMNE